MRLSMVDRTTMSARRRREVCGIGAPCLLLLLLLLSAAAGTASAHGRKKSRGVAYDGRSLIINGRRELIFSGSIHYPRSPPEMWPGLIAKAKQGGINTISTYVFWNIHEPQLGQFNFEGRNDIVKFIKLVHQQGLYLILRIGPFVESEWNFGGFPFWLKEIPDITFRTNNEPFKYHMKRYCTMIVNKMKEEQLFASQGGPIILTQIENEYNNVAASFKEDAGKYVEWAAKMAVGLNTGVPWIMCKQRDVPDPVINTCNGRNCGDTFTGPNKPHKPSLWTENWTAQYRVFGDPPSQRSAEDLAYSVARFFSKNGTLANYYMYYGGTNYGRTGSSFVMTRYYDEAPLDEFGMPKEPKWGHIKDLHMALKLCRKALLWGTPSHQSLGQDLEARVYEKPSSNVCVAFLSNADKRVDKTVVFRGKEYFLPHRSISILPDCKTVVYNTQRVLSQHNVRTYHFSKQSNNNTAWRMHREVIPTINQCPIKSPLPLELLKQTKDKTDYLWYSTSFNLERADLPMRRDIRPVIQVSNFGHAMHAFVNDVYIGTGHGNKMDKSFSFSKPADLKVGTNHISLLCMTVGLPASGGYMEHRIAGVHNVAVQGLNTGTLDLTSNGWGHKIGMEGEQMGAYTQEGSRKVHWSRPKKNYPVTWYKRYFDMPHGKEPVAVDLSSMKKGMVWINGESLGRYWVSYLNPLGKSSQTVYHIPRVFLKPKDNLMVVYEELGGDPEEISILTVKRDNICSIVTVDHPAHVSSWKRKDNQIQAVADEVVAKARLACTDNKVIRSIAFASFGNPEGNCGELVQGNCHAESSKSVVEKECLGKQSCEVPATPAAFGADGNCSGASYTLAIQAKCSRKKGRNSS